MSVELLMAVIGGLVVLVLLLLLLLRRRAGGDTVRQALRAEKAGQWTTAARFWLAADEAERAYDMYVRAESWLAAAELAIRLGKKDRAASLYERAGKFAEAAGLLEDVRQFGPAARLWLRAGQGAKAGQLYERIGDFESAARAFVEAGELRRAGELHLKRQRVDQALPLLRRAWDAERAALQDRHTAAERRNQVIGLGDTLGRLLEKRGDLEGAIALAREIGHTDRAVSLLIERGRPEDAAGLLRDVGRAQDAARVLEESGRGDQAMRLHAEALSEQGEPLQAARLLERIGDHAAALPLFIEAGAPAAAAGVAEQLGQWVQAAKLHLQARDPGKAAVCLAKAGQWDEAARVYQKLGDRQKMVEMLVRGGKFYEAAQHLVEAGDIDRALILLDRVEPAGSGPWRRARLQRGELLLKRGDQAGAIAAIAAALDGQKVQAATLEGYYQLGTLYEEAGERERALEIWDRILRYDPRYRDVQDRQAVLRPVERVEAAPVEAVPAEGPDSEPARSGSRRRRYMMLEELGRGGMGIVYKALDRTLERIVAYKVLPTDLRRNEAVVRNFFHEAKAAAALTHPNIVVVYDAGEDDDTTYIAMEYIEGRTLKQMLRDEGPFPPPLLLLVGAQTCRGLAYAHSRRIVHRDIKPSNLMWQPSEKQVKIADFGLAKVIQEVVNFQTVVGGTPHYMAPEQILGEEVDQRSDIYSLGASLYELATGQVPFPKGDAGYHHIHSDVPDPVKLRPDLPRPLADVIMRCLRKDPADRFQDADAVLEALQAARGQLGG
jgi:tetratricopeptide (TPR) repeat protein